MSQMMDSPKFFFLFVFTIVCYFNVVVANDPFYQALMFNYETLKLQQPSKLTDDNEKRTNCLTACPDGPKSAQIINIRFSKAGDSVFLYTNHENVFIRDVESEICANPYKASIVLDTSTNTYETGYELYYDVVSVELKCGKYDQLQKVQIFNDDERNKKQLLGVENIKVDKTESQGNTKFKVFASDRRTWTFYWISVLSIRISGYRRQISFAGDTINYYHSSSTMSMCKDYNLGDEIHKVPSQAWQQFQEKQSSTSPPKKKLNSATLEEIQIIPMRYFHTLAAKLATCIHLNIAYVWRSIAIQQYKEVDLYLYSIYKLWPSNVNIIFGVEGASPDISDTRLVRINPPNNEIFKKFPLPIPRIIYRIFEYNFSDVTYNAIVIIHNTQETVKIDERICDKEQEVKSWDYIRVENHASGLTYVCPVTEQIIEKLAIRYEINATMRPLELNSFLHKDEKSGTIKNEDVRDKILQEVGYNKYYDL
ncbi:uncharacterized protein LOC135847817 [Planococcus citri]|uniref:uncharacterized protein LOC135847817 n=1 Tax=Planococcus citri TaxID=170843 RepID=UPI0031F91123